MNYYVCIVVLSKQNSGDDVSALDLQIRTRVKESERKFCQVERAGMFSRFR